MEVTVELGGTGVMVVQVISEATVALERATVALARITAVLVKALEVLERAMEALEDMERVSGNLEDMVVLDIHLMASEEDTLEWAHTLMAVQVLFMECQDMGRWHTAHKLLLTTHNHKLMTHNLLHLMQPLPHNHLQPMEALELALLQGQLMTQLLQPMRLLHTVFLLAMVFGIQNTNLYKVVSNISLRSNQGLINSLLHSLLQSQCDVFTMLFHLIKTSSLNLDCR